MLVKINNLIGRLKVPNLKLPQPLTLSGVLFFGAIAVAVIGAYIYNRENPLVTTVSFLPLIVIVLIARKVTRRSEVSSWLMLLAIAWGAVGSIVLTVALNEYTSTAFYDGDPTFDQMTILNAPLTEEFSKGLFLVVLMLIVPHLIRNPLIGGVLGGLVGAGFAYTENLLYLNAGAEQGMLWQLFLLRCVLSWFLHAIATMFIGFFIGHVVNKHYGFFWSVFLINVGFVGGMAIHGLWNGLADLFDDEIVWLTTFYVPFWLPLLAIFGVSVWAVRKRSNQIIDLIYGNFVEHDFIPQYVVNRLSDPTQRAELADRVGVSTVDHYESMLFIIDFYDRKAIKNYDKPRTYKNAMLNRGKAVERFATVQNSLA